MLNLDECLVTDTQDLT